MKGKNFIFSTFSDTGSAFPTFGTRNPIFSFALEPANYVADTSSANYFYLSVSASLFAK